jgi:hypothetical protein
MVINTTKDVNSSPGSVYSYIPDITSLYKEQGPTLPRQQDPTIGLYPDHNTNQQLTTLLIQDHFNIIFRFIFKATK